MKGNRTAPCMSKRALHIGGQAFACLLILLSSQRNWPQNPNGTAPAIDIGGPWTGTVQGSDGEVEFYFVFQMAKDGKLSGARLLNSGDDPISEGQVTGNTLQFSESREYFGTVVKTRFSGEIVGAQIRLAITSNDPASLPPVLLHRGEPQPSYRAGRLDYKTLPKPVLPPRRDVPANGLAQTPPMGWNSWNRFATAIDDKTVREVAAAIASNGMKDAGYQYIVIDDGWEWKRGEDGKIMPNPKFPDMKALTDYVHSLGLKIGIYSSPGPRTCGGYEGSYGHEEQDAQTFADWGFDYLKYDLCSARRVYTHEQMRAAYQKMGEALLTTGRPIVYALCQYGLDHVEQWGPSVGANLWRTTEDISDGFSSMLENGLAEADLGSFAGPGHWNDPDMLEIGNGGMTKMEYQTHLSLWAMLAAPLLAGNDVRSLSADTREILLNKDVLAVDQDPLGKQGHRVIQSGKTEVWLKPLAGNASAVALFNWSAKLETVSIHWSDLKLNPKSLRDLWTHADVKKDGDSFNATIPAHGVVMLRAEN